VETPPLDGAQWGILFAHTGSAEVVHALHPQRRLIPASTRKIPVVAAALELLGPGYRWETAFFAAAPPDDSGVVEADLHLRSGGDPTLGPPFHPSATAALDSLAALVHAAGVRTVRGALVLELGGWDTTSVPASWMTEDLTVPDGATGGPFAVGLGEVALRVVGAPVAGEFATVTAEPAGPEGFLDVQVRTRAGRSPTPGGIRAVHLPESRRIRLEGEVQEGEERELRIAVREPALVAGHTLFSALLRRGIRVEGGVRLNADPEVLEEGELPGEGVLLASLPSPPLSQVAPAILGPSRNWMAEQLVRTLGAEMEGRGGWAEGLRAESDWLTEVVGVAREDFVSRDGSGLSVQNLLTPRALIQVLHHMARSPDFAVFREALAEPGEAGTTLAARLGGLEGRAFAKTGGMTHIQSLAGYLRTEGGDWLAFAILANASGLPAPVVRDAIDALVRNAAGR